MFNWKDSFLQELQEVCAKHKITDFSAFIFWYIKATENFPDSKIMEETIITDRSRDASCDAVIIDHDMKIVKIIQSKFTQKIGESSYNKDELNKLNSVYDYLTGKKDYDILREYIHKNLKEKLDKAIRFVKDNGYGVKLYFITTHKSNPNSNIYDNLESQINILSSKEIERKYGDWRHGHTPELGEIEVPYQNLMEGPLDPKSYVVILKSEVLRKEYLKWKDKLFSRNVRIFYGISAKKPNKYMKKTLSDEPQNFWYFNNGITILSEKVTPKKEDQKIILKNPQIINGCQTVSVIGETRQNDAFLFVKIIEIGDDLINQNFIDGIIEANNRQTPVDERILKSNHPLQVKLQRNLESLGFYFERKEKQFKEEKAKSNIIAKLDCIKNIDLVRCNIAIIKSPHISHAKEDELFSNYFDQVFLENNSTLDYLIPYLIWKEIEWIGKNYRGDSRKRFHKLASFHVLRMVYDNCQELNNSIMINEIYKKLKSKTFEFNQPIIKRLFDISYDKFNKSKFKNVDSGQRDFFRKNETIKNLSDAVPVSLGKQIQQLFDN